MSAQSLPIFDIDFALSQFSGNQSLLIKILDKFIDQNKDFAQQLGTHLNKDDLSEAKRQIHTLKGVAGNLGFKALTQACKDVESHFNTQPNEQRLEILLQLLNTSLNSATEYTTTANDAGSPVNSAAVNTSTDITTKKLLIAALTRNEFLSSTKLARYLAALALPAEESAKLAQYIDNFDYENALLMLK